MLQVKCPRYCASWNLYGIISSFFPRTPYGDSLRLTGEDNEPATSVGSPTHKNVNTDISADRLSGFGG